MSAPSLPPPYDEGLPEGLTIRLRTIRDDLPPVSQKIVDFVCQESQKCHWNVGF
jgi:hypothetical protein